MHRFPVLAEMFAGTLEAWIEDLLLDVVNLADVVFDGTPARLRRIYYEDDEDVS